MIRNALLAVIILALFSSCNQKQETDIFAASNQAVAGIMKEITGDKAEIFCPVSPGASPHTFNPSPSDAVKIEGSKAFIYASETLDAWAKSVKADNKIRLIDFVAEDIILSFEETHSHEGHDHSREHRHVTNVDPHFWTDPIAVKSIIPALVEQLSKIDPANGDYYKENGISFAEKLDKLHVELAGILEPVKSAPVFLFHPSFKYMIKRYGLHYLGAIETSPGKEPTPKYLKGIIERINSANAKAIFTEPQLPKGPATTIAEAAGVKLFELDPVGGSEGRDNIFDLLKYNAEIIAGALK